MSKLVEVGRIIKAHGIRGELCIDYHADSPKLLSASVYLAPAGAGSGVGDSPVPYTVTSLRMHQGRPLLTLEGVPDRTAAEFLRGRRVFIPQERLPKLGPNEIYMSDLPGLEVLVREKDGSLSALGRISMAEDLAGQEIWTITTPTGQEALLPVTEAFVESVNLAENIAVITPPPGLLDIYLKA